MPRNVAKINNIMHSEYITIQFGYLKQPNSLRQSQKWIKDGHYQTDRKCKVVKEIQLTPKDYVQLTQNLAENRPDVWEKLGGATSDDSRLDNKDFMQVYSNPELMQIFKETCYTEVVKVLNIATKQYFYVNPEGYDYARYVSRVYNA